ncbi:2-hydroxy-3-oxopropionate reductase-like [Tubulanus polymorphus]|uniref:2-hydroxy-3-oxopropionate reductase-like n=1 Tax=Tubulanus polymorphus TaxID=672921 RepID=UPI003DA3440D
MLGLRSIIRKLRSSSTLSSTCNNFAKRYSNSATTSPDKLNVGVIGAGNIGCAVCVGLTKAGHNVKVYDPNETNAAFLKKIGAEWSRRELDVATDANVLITAVPAPPHVRHVMEEIGVLRELREGACWIDHTTTDKNESIRLARVAESRNVNMLEAPLTGGLELLKAGLMTVLVGGDENVLRKYEPIVRTYTETVLHMGPVGSASVVKIISNMLAGAHVVISAEAVMLAKRQGVNMQAFFDGIRASAGNSYVFETEVPLMYNGTCEPGFTIALHNKDFALGRELCAESRVPMEVMGLVDQIYRKAQNKYGDDVGSTWPAKLIEDDLHESMQIDGYENWCYKIEKVTGGGIAVVHKFDKKHDD